MVHGSQRITTISAHHHIMKVMNCYLYSLFMMNTDCTLITFFVVIVVVSDL